MSLYARLALLAASVLLVLGIGWKIHHAGYERGMDYVHRQWDAERLEQQAAALKQSQANARETFRRLEAQQENQRVQDRELAAARADAARADAAAERMREQAASAARAWRNALRDSPAGSIGQAAAAAITVQADVQRRLVAAGGELTRYADAARAAGLKCERDYTSLTER